jgi:hypothetical protein
MDEHKKWIKINTNSGGTGCILWIAAWIFTIGYLKLGFWEAVLAIIVWPYYLGSALSIVQ